MSPKNRIIIDTDPGVDDVLAMLLAFSANPDELEILMLSITYGNIDVQNCLRNVVSLFHFIEKEQAWRKQNGLPEGFDALKAHKPIVAVGAENPLTDTILMADYFHGTDGLGGIHSTHPHLSPEETWRTLFTAALKSSDPEVAAAAREAQSTHSLFTPSNRSAPEEILRLLRENDPNTVTIVAIGPLTNLAIAAASDPEAFLRVKEVVIMGGAIDHVGNITPVAEFNTIADSIAAARVYALSSPNPASTMPPVPPAPSGKQSNDPPPPYLQPYPEKLSRQLTIKMFPLDLTTPHQLKRGLLERTVTPLVSEGSPLAEWVNAFLSSTLKKIESLSEGITGPEVGLELHDPLCIWYCMSSDDSRWKTSSPDGEDIRIETSGQWTRGMCVVDRRNRRRRPDDGEGGEIAGDTGNWLNVRAGNRVDRIVSSPGADVFGEYLIKKVFSL